MEYLLFYPDSHQHLGLFEDLKGMPNIEMDRIGLKKINSRVLQGIRRLHISWTINKHVALPLKTIWYTKPEIELDDSKQYCIIVMDGAMKGLQPKVLNNWFSRENVRGVLVLINSMDASSVAILELKDKFSKVQWDAVYSFDPADVKKYEYSYLGTCYYSLHDLEAAHKQFPDEQKSTVYYTGGLKGGREELILSVFDMLQNNGVSLNFNLAISGERRLREKPFSETINYYSGGWFPYERVLSGIDQTKIILDVHQKGQTGPSLRYYEAVCYNKKLLSNNPAITMLPYYDPRYMKVFCDTEDIDINWIKEDVNVDYHYKGEFSPVHMLDVVAS